MYGSNRESRGWPLLLEAFCGSVTDLPTSPFAFFPFSPLTLIQPPPLNRESSKTEIDIEARGEGRGGGRKGKSGESVFVA